MAGTRLLYTAKNPKLRTLHLDGHKHASHKDDTRRGGCQMRKRRAEEGRGEDRASIKTCKTYSRAYKYP